MMNKKVKAELIKALRVKHEKTKKEETNYYTGETELIPIKLSPAMHFPIQKVIIEVLKEMHPDIDFDSLVATKQKGSFGENELELKKEKIVGARGPAWDNFLEYSGLERVDFFIPGFTFSDSEKGEINPLWSRGYKHPTIGSIIHHAHYSKLDHDNPITYGRIADIIEKHL